MTCWSSSALSRSIIANLLTMVCRLSGAILLIKASTCRCSWDSRSPAATFTWLTNAVGEGAGIASRFRGADLSAPASRSPAALKLAPSKNSPLSFFSAFLPFLLSSSAAFDVDFDPLDADLAFALGVAALPPRVPGRNPRLGSGAVPASGSFSISQPGCGTFPSTNRRLKSKSRGRTPSSLVDSDSITRSSSFTSLCVATSSPSLAPVS
mmetsp:Transcript_56437/g.150324  ORF Transcript_56437/g.150324 Transcript_56437/m.150324 type:complete len:209 (-) Transcript_56437:345-971(-)